MTQRADQVPKKCAAFLKWLYGQEGHYVPILKIPKEYDTPDTIATCYDRGWIEDASRGDTRQKVILDGKGGARTEYLGDGDAGYKLTPKGVGIGMVSNETPDGSPGMFRNRFADPDQN